MSELYKRANSEFWPPALEGRYQRLKQVMRMLLETDPHNRDSVLYAAYRQELMAMYRWRVAASPHFMPV